MMITPSASGAAIAGGGFWGLLWSFLFKADHFPILKRFVPKDRILDWMTKNKAECLILTEAINLGTHSSGGALGVTFALGGTVVNAIMIFIGLPIRSAVRRKRANTKVRLNFTGVPAVAGS
jgi:hypothetical protein